MDVGLLSLPILAEALITWTPVTFYVASGIVQTIVILLSFKLMSVDPEHNTIIGAIIAGIVINLIAFFARDYGLMGVLATGAAIFGMLVAITSGEALKAAMAAAICMAVYLGVGTVVIPKTPLTADKIGGLPAVMLKGGLEEEPLDGQIEKEFYEEKAAP